MIFYLVVKDVKLTFISTHTLVQNFVPSSCQSLLCLHLYEFKQKFVKTKLSFTSKQVDGWKFKKEKPRIIDRTENYKLVVFHVLWQNTNEISKCISIPIIRTCYLLVNMK